MRTLLLALLALTACAEDHPTGREVAEAIYGASIQRSMYSHGICGEEAEAYEFAAMRDFMAYFCGVYDCEASVPVTQEAVEDCAVRMYTDTQCSAMTCTYPTCGDELFALVPRLD